MIVEELVGRERMQPYGKVKAMVAMNINATMKVEEYIGNNAIEQRIMKNKYVKMVNVC